MPRNKGSSPSSYLAIFNQIKNEPKYFSEIVNTSGLTRKTVGKKLSHLTSSGLLMKKRVGMKVFYSLPDDEKSNFSWIKKWAILISKKNQWMNIYVDLVCEFNKEKFLDIARDVVDKMLLESHKEDISKPENQALLKYASENGIKIYLKNIVINTYSLYCPECLIKKRELIISRTQEDSNIHTCTACGLEFTVDDFIKILSDE